MTTRQDAYWDELGVAWRAIELDGGATMGQLQARLRRQSAVIIASLVLGLPLAVAGFVLGAITIWRGWTAGTWNFITRGFAIAVISAIAARTLWLLLPARASADARALPEMLRLSIRRAESTLTILRLGFLVCVLTAVFGLVGTVLRTYQSRPPAMSPFIDLAVLAITALGLFLYRRRTKLTLAKFQYLQQAIAPDPQGTESK